MATPRIYTGQTLAPGQTFTLEPGASQHLARALRKVAGDQLTLFNGDGIDYAAELVNVERKAVVVQVNGVIPGHFESPLVIHLGVAISRGERMDWVVQKATELGVAAISPLYTARSGVKLAGERADKKVRHWRNIAISACEQCGRNRLPTIANPLDLSEWLVSTEAPLRLVLHHRAAPAQTPQTAPENLALLVGPEGGLSAAEIEAAEAAGYASLSLGPRVLRTETAPLAALAILQARWGDM